MLHTLHMTISDEKMIQIIKDIRLKLSKGRTRENIDTFHRLRDNIANLVSMTNEASVMRQMPSIPVKINFELADAIIRNLNLHKYSMNANAVAANIAYAGNSSAANSATADSAAMSQQQATTKMSTQSSLMVIGGMPQESQ